jgi:hypothetical protein
MPGSRKENAIMFFPLARKAVALDICDGWMYFAAFCTVVLRLNYVCDYGLGVTKIRTMF